MSNLENCIKKLSVCSLMCIIYFRMRSDEVFSGFSSSKATNVGPAKFPSELFETKLIFEEAS